MQLHSFLWSQAWLVMLLDTSTCILPARICLSSERLDIVHTLAHCKHGWSTSKLIVMMPTISFWLWLHDDSILIPPKEHFSSHSQQSFQHHKQASIHGSYIAVRRLSQNFRWGYIESVDGGALQPISFFGSRYMRQIREFGCNYLKFVLFEFRIIKYHSYVDYIYLVQVDQSRWFLELGSLHHSLH